MMSSEQHNIFFQWLPSTNGEIEYAKLEAGEYMNKPPLPCIIVGREAGGGRSQFFDDLLRIDPNDEGDEVETWGQYHKCTFYIIIKASSRQDRDEILNWFLKRVFATRYELDWDTNKIRLNDVLLCIPIPPERDDQSQRVIYRGAIDLELEYEVSWTLEEDYIRRFNVTAPGVGTGVIE